MVISTVNRPEAEIRTWICPQSSVNIWTVRLSDVWPLRSRRVGRETTVWLITTTLGRIEWEVKRREPVGSWTRAALLDYIPGLLISCRDPKEEITKQTQEPGSKKQFDLISLKEILWPLSRRPSGPKCFQKPLKNDFQSRLNGTNFTELYKSFELKI